MWDGVKMWLNRLQEQGKAENMRFAVIKPNRMLVSLQFKWPQSISLVKSHVPGIVYEYPGYRNLQNWIKLVHAKVFNEKSGDRPDAPNVLFCKILFL